MKATGENALLITSDGEATLIDRPQDCSDWRNGRGEQITVVATIPLRTAAAAPALLEALTESTRMLEAAHRDLGMWSDTNPRIMRHRAAIATAT